MVWQGIVITEVTYKLSFYSGYSSARNECKFADRSLIFVFHRRNGLGPYLFELNDADKLRPSEDFVFEYTSGDYYFNYLSVYLSVCLSVGLSVYWSVGHYLACSSYGAISNPISIIMCSNSDFGVGK